jgi:hypothetical protein
MLAAMIARLTFHTVLVLTIILLTISHALAQSAYDEMPFSTNDKNFTVWNGDEYVPFFIKGVNLGIAQPGTHPGELAARRSDYARWFKLMQEAGFNTIRLYTLHFPHFYQTLDSFNRANPNRPLYFFQGIWIEEEIEGYTEDLYQLTAAFEEEMTGNIGAVHGNITIASKPGKAFGTYTADVSKYMVGYIVGREIHPPEVWHTNDIHAEDNQYQGDHLSITDASASEVWMTQMLDEVLQLEYSAYDMTHPISFSSWPTLDPLHHTAEPNRYEDSVSIDLSRLEITNAPAGYFSSYHSYPYYPDFMSRQADYLEEADYLGQNSYLGYLKDLKAHYERFPLLIAEFGTSSSWGVAHYAQSGIHHGGATELEQGDAYLRMFRNLHEAETAGGIQFAWMDEWFKRTWITDPLDFNADRRVLWQNVTAAEQNFGLIGFKKSGNSLQPWENICADCNIKSTEAGADYTFFRLKLNLSEELAHNDTLWVSLDTYADELGESILPNGDTLEHRAEFCIMVTHGNAYLFVTQAYDLFGIWHGTSSTDQIFQSTQTDGAPWKLVRWKNNNTLNEIQYIGRLGVNRLNLPLKSTDAVIITEQSVEFRLPWTLIQFTDPSARSVLHDDKNTATREEQVSEGIGIDLLLRDQHHASAERYTWDGWEYPDHTEEYLKKSYDVILQGMESIPSAPLAHADSYHLDEDSWVVTKNQGLLVNDVYFGNSTPHVYVVEAPKNGLLQLNADGSFKYQPVDHYSGSDSFTYQLIVGSNASVPVSVSLDVESPLKVSETAKYEVTLYPNPAAEVAHIKADQEISNIEVFDSKGQLLITKVSHKKEDHISVQGLSRGIYMVRLTLDKEQIIFRLVKD